MKNNIKKAMLLSAMVCGFGLVSPQAAMADDNNTSFEQGHLKSVDAKYKKDGKEYVFVTTREGEHLLYITDANGNTVVYKQQQ